ncbi:MAG: MarR family transcriptional regulator [Blautia sp.]|uniref:MarR family winged helix-turn-helix transcriptional regulator n=1 Tax=Blautia TaxID=572511 RepID=UPI001FA91666|nr:MULTISPECIES: MarR family transcriptional regulator [Blautia]
MELEATDMRLLMRGITKLYEQYLERIRGKYGLSQIEITIIGFLYNNPGKDTAAEIVELRMLPKGNVSQGVELLVKKGFLRRNTDRTDRRKVHLSLEETAIPLCNEIEKVNQSFKEQLLQGLTQQEKETYEKINRQLMKNIEKGMNFDEK